VDEILAFCDFSHLFSILSFAQILNYYNLSDEILQQQNCNILFETEFEITDC